LGTAVIVPVKDFGQAKSRLAALLSPDERQELATIMLRRVLQAISALDRRIEKFVVTSFSPAIELARSLGIKAMVESRQVSESDSVDRASLTLENDGFEAVLRVPLDLPFVAPADLELLLKAQEKGLQGVLVPSLDGTGTNALYRSPPSLFASRFGPGSLAAHEASLIQLGVPYAVMACPSLALDVDDPSDVANLLEEPRNSPAKQFLLAIGARQRLAALNRERA